MRNHHNRSKLIVVTLFSVLSIVTIASKDDKSLLMQYYQSIIQDGQNDNNTKTRERHRDAYPYEIRM